jgi:transposase
MIALSSGVRILVACQPCDFRKGLDGLIALVQEVLLEDCFAGGIFIFRSKRGDRVKLVTWDGTGLWLHYKRLEQGRFVWPSPVDGVVQLSAAQASVLLDGLDWRRVKQREVPRPLFAC